MRFIYMFFVVLAGIAAILTLDQIWFSYLTLDIYFKIIITEAVIAGLVLAAYLLKHEFLDDKKLKKDKYTN